MEDDKRRFTGSEKLIQCGNMNLTHLANSFLGCERTDAEGGGSDEVGGLAQAWREHPGAGAGDGAFRGTRCGAICMVERRPGHKPATKRGELSIMSRATTRIGLGATLSSTFYPPYHLARSLGTLDLMSGGRVAGKVVASHGHLEAQNFGLHELRARDMRYDYADEVVEAVCKLWESWDADALVLDKRHGVFADPDKVHYVNYHGRWINTRGPLTVLRMIRSLTVSPPAPEIALSQ